MSDRANVVGLEIIVGRISDAVDVLVEGFGWDVVYRGRSGDVAGETAVLDAGSITVTLLQPDDHGPGMLSDREPRLSQIVVGGTPLELDGAADRLVRLGLPTHGAGAGRRFVPPEAAAGVLGFETALMMLVTEGDASDER